MSSPSHRRLLERVAQEAGRLSLLFAYFAVILVAFGVYRRLLLSSYAIDPRELGANAIAALLLAKVVLVGESVGLGERPGTGPLFRRTIYKSVLYGIAVFVAVGVDRLLDGLLHKQSPAEVWRAVASGGWHEPVARAAIVFISFLPFFALRETLHDLQQALGGEQSVRQLFFRMRRPPKAGAPSGG